MAITRDTRLLGDWFVAAEEDMRDREDFTGLIGTTRDVSRGTATLDLLPKAPFHVEQIA